MNFCGNANRDYLPHLFAFSTKSCNTIWRRKKWPVSMPRGSPTTSNCLHFYSWSTLKQLIRIGSLPNESSFLLTNKQDDNIVSQAVVCSRAARWQWLCDSSITKQCVVTWPATERVFKDAEEREGDIKLRQMGWNNGIIELVCGKLHQRIVETETWRR